MKYYFMYKKYISLLALLLIVFVGRTNAQLFWKVTGNGLKQTSYLFGTHHIIDKSQIMNFDKILEICGQSDATVGELVMSDPAMQSKLMQGATITDGSIKDLVSQEDYTLLDTTFRQLMGAGMDQLGKIEPIMLNSLYSVMVYLKNNNISKQPEAVDKLFQEKAVENGKKVIGLETVEDQIDVLFNTFSLKRQADMLVESVKEKEKGLEVLANLNLAYMSGDLNKLEILEKEEQGDMTDEEMKLFIDDRNNKWMQKIPGLFSQQSCFVAVGCLHLAGQTGLINQLRKSGYIVEPVILN
jgi:uncharacterized protein